MVKIKRVSVTEIARPLRITFSTSLGSKNILRSIKVKVILTDGACGLGEIPTSFSLRHESITAIKHILRKVSPIFINSYINDYEDKIAQLRKKFFKYPMTIFGLEVALFLAYLKNENIAEHIYWGAKSPRLETDITITFIVNAGFSMLVKTKTSIKNQVSTILSLLYMINHPIGITTVLLSIETALFYLSEKKRQKTFQIPPLGILDILPANGSS